VPSTSFELSIRTAIHPEANTGLQGLFVRAGSYATEVRMHGCYSAAAAAAAAKCNNLQLCCILLDIS
jgi:hypothetical protein